MGDIDKTFGGSPESATHSNATEAVSYSSYLQVEPLTQLQTPLSNPPAHDEMLFIVTHQTYELWFKQVLYEMRALIPFIENNELLRSYRLLERICEIFKVLIQQVDILETMTPVEFNRFRSLLNPASGFQSLQFREFELLAGAPQTDYTKLLKLNPEWKDKLVQGLDGPTLRGAFLSLLRSQNLLQSDSEAEILKAILAIYHDPKWVGLHNLCEYLIRFDEQVLLWRFRHVQMVERMIGMKRGTGGSLGVSYLQQTLQKKFFAELWDARTEMGAPT